MKKTILLLLTLAISISGCKKDDEENIDENDGNVNGMYIETIKQGNDVLLRFSYDANHRLIKTNIYYNGSELEITYTYTGNNLTGEIAKSGNTLVHQYTYQYDNSGNLSRCDLTVPSGQVYWEYTYNNDNKIIESIQYHNGQPANKRTYFYTGNNMTEAVEYYRFGSIWEEQHRVVMEYDNKDNPMFLHHLPFSEVMDEFADFISPNNQTHVTEYDQWGAVESDITYSYTYNAQGYPYVVEQTEGGSIVTYNIYYE
jgi:hypothetical protein